MEFVIVTGYSGAGKSVALHALEDIGFYCIDNLPPQLTETFYELCKGSVEQYSRVAVIIDIRAGFAFSKFKEILSHLKENGMDYTLVFLDCKRDVRMNRYKETRRKHPLIDEDTSTIEAAMDREAELLAPLRAMADIIIDSSFGRPADMREKIVNTFLHKSSDAIKVLCMSFGFKNGIPNDADIVFDVRCLPNPFYIPELKHQTGLDSDVRDYVFSFNETAELLNRLVDLIDYTLPLYIKEGKSRLVIAIGCTGGHHRSVAISQYIADHLRDNGIEAATLHRDITR